MKVCGWSVAMIRQQTPVDMREQRCDYVIDIPRLCQVQIIAVPGPQFFWAFSHARRLTWLTRQRSDLATKSHQFVPPLPKRPRQHWAEKPAPGEGVRQLQPALARLQYFWLSMRTCRHRCRVAFEGPIVRRLEPLMIIRGLREFQRAEDCFANALWSTTDTLGQRPLRQGTKRRIYSACNVVVTVPDGKICMRVTTGVSLHGPFE